jgi:hypothetical protein
MDQVKTYRMPPVHASPECPIGVVLIEEVVFAFPINKSIGIIHPIRWWKEMVSGSVQNLLEVLFTSSPQARQGALSSKGHHQRDKEYHG